MSDRVTMPALGESVTEGHRHPVAQARRRPRRGRRAIARGVDRQGRHRDPVAGRRHAAADPGRGGRDREVGAELAVIGDGEGAGGAPARRARAAPAPTQAAARAGTGARAAGRRHAGRAVHRAAGRTPDAPRPRQPAPRAAVSGGETVTMPALGESVTEGTVTRWLKQVGDQVEVDEPLARGVDRQGRHRDPVARSPGRCCEIKVARGRDRRGRRDAGRDRCAGAAAAGSGACPRPRPRPAPAPAPAPDARRPQLPAPAPAPAPARRRPHPPPAAPAPAHRQPAAAAGRQPRADDGVYVTPLVRKLAAQHGVDLRASPAPASAGGSASRTCSTPPPRGAPQAAAGRRSSGAAAAAAAPAAPAAARPWPRRPLRGTTEKMSRLRKVIAQRMVESLQVSAQLTTVVEVDVTRIARLRDQAKADFAAARGRQAVLPAVLRQGRRRGAQGAPERQRLDRRGGGHGHLPRPREPRDRGRHRARPARPGHQGRRRPQHRRAGPQDRRPGRAHPHQQDHARTSCPAGRSR